MYTQRLLKYETFICNACHSYFYDESKGDIKQHIPAGTQVDNLPKEWRCPNCGAKKRLYPVLALDGMVETKDKQ